MNKGLLALALGGLAIGMTEFTMMGILPDIAADLGMEIPQAAHLIAFYALGVVVGAPTLVLITGRFAPKKVLMALMMVFFVFNGLFALAPGPVLIQISRFMAGLPHGAFFGVGSVVATGLAAKGKEARAISIMFTGLTVANLLGVPIGTYIGHHFSWRISYGIVSILGLVTLSALYFWLPDVKKKSGNNVLQQLTYYKKGRGWLLIAVVSIGTGGLFAWISYIAPLVIHESGLDPDRVPVIMVLVGFGMVIGNLLGGKLSDLMGPVRATITCFSMMAICLLVVHFTSPISWLAYPVSFITGIISFTAGSPIQMMLINDAKGAETFAASAGQASFNMGNTLGAFLGGIPLTLGFAYDTPVLVGAGMAVIGVMLTIFYGAIYESPYRQRTGGFR